MPSCWRRPVLLAVRLACAAIPIAWVCSRLSWSSLAAVADATPPLVLGAALLCLLGNMFVGSVRWRLLLRAYGEARPPAVLTLFRHYLVGAYFNLLPGGVAGEAVRGVRVRSDTLDTVGSLTILVVERIVGLLGLMGLVLLTLPLVPGSGARLVRVSLLLGAGLAFVLGLLALGMPGLLARRPELRRRLTGLPVVGRVLARIPAARSVPLLAACVALSLCTQAASLGAHLVVTAALTTSRDTAAALGVLPLIVLTTHIPLAPAAIGQREAAFVYLYGLVGIAPAVAVATSVAVFIAILGVTGIGGACFLLERRGAAPEAARREAA